uniref:Uncharacterized protein n=1 Tax=Aegilops tauschii subsp. strangulata TaxID=200361 RepID=A0A453R1D1_AEGTS
MAHSAWSMLHNDMMVGTLSYSTTVGKLWKELLDVPCDARWMFPRYTIDETETDIIMRYFQIKLVSSDGF